MRSLSGILGLCAVALGALSVFATLGIDRTWSDDNIPRVDALDNKQVVLLKNDRCITGVVRRIGDQVVIEIDSDARVSKPATEVQFIGSSLEEIYQYKVSRYQRLGPGENIRLARWCLNAGLPQHASHHFLLVHREAPNDVTVKQVGVELREQLLKDENFRSYLGLAPLPATASDTQIRTVSTSGQSDSSHAPLHGVVLNSFSEQVQPILLNRCSQSGCHGISATNGLKIIQPLGSARARITEQNCRSALGFVEVDESNMSRLLRYALTPHGVQREASISVQEKNLLDTLQAWTTFARNPVMAAVESSARDAKSTEAAPAVYLNADGKKMPSGNNLTPVGPNANKLRTVPNLSSPNPTPAGTAPASPTGGPSGAGRGAGGPSKSELDSLDDQVRKALGEPPRGTGATSSNSKATGQSTSRIDPFDPADFNRRVAADRP